MGANYSSQLGQAAAGKVRLGLTKGSGVGIGKEAAAVLNDRYEAHAVRQYMEREQKVCFWCKPAERCHSAGGAILAATTLVAAA